MKQFITRKTNIFPQKYTQDYMIEFMELLDIKSILPKDIMRRIDAQLFL